MTEQLSAVWVRTDPSPEGVYMVSIDSGEGGDFAMPLDRERALRYAMALLTAAQYAIYDAAVIRQMTEKVGVDLDHAAEVIKALRADRPPIDDEATEPLTYAPIVFSQTRRPGITIHYKGEQVGQWEAADGVDHATHVLNSIIVADLDGAYLRCLTGVLNVDENTGRNIVADVGAYRVDVPEGESA